MIRDSRFFQKTAFDEKKIHMINSRELAELKSVLLKMLSDFINVCEKNGISYSLGGGSVLGAVRHHGMIPWDDDIDVILFRKDYSKFISVFENELSDNYVLCAPQIGNDHGMAQTQIKKKNTIFRSFNELTKADDNCGIYIDIFIAENVPDSFALSVIHGIICLAFGYVLTCRKTFSDIEEIKKYLNTEGSAAKKFRIKARIGRLFSMFSLDSISRITDRVYSLCKNDESKYVTIPTGRKHFFGEKIRRTFLKNTVSSQFNGIIVQIPEHSEEYLIQLYGRDYMMLPPMEKRETHPVMELKI